MSKPDPVQRALERLGELRQAAPTDAVVEELRQYLRNRSNLVVAKAAKLAGDLNVRAFVPELLLAFDKLMADAPRLDKRCAALTEIASALYQLDCDEAAPYLRGLRHFQPEASYGPPVDAAAKLRGLSALGLLRTRHPDALHEMLPLLVDSEAPARIGAVRALATNGGEAGILLLKLKAMHGDAEPEVLAECFSGLLAAAPEKSVKFVARYIDSDDEAIAEGAILALGESRHQAAFEVLAEKWSRTISRPSRKILLLAMASSRLEEAIAFLISIVADSSTQTAVDAIAALAPYRSSERVKSLLSDAVVRRNEKAVTKEFDLHFS